MRFYQRRYAEWRVKMGAVASGVGVIPHDRPRCPRYLAHLWQRKAHAARVGYHRYVEYHWHWWKWLPDKWARIGACETGYGKPPGQWTWNSGTYQGAFGFHHGSWDAFKPVSWWPHAAYLATPWQQYKVALRIHARYGFTGWGCYMNRSWVRYG